MGGFVRSLHLGQTPRQGIVAGGVGSGVTMAALGVAYHVFHLSADLLICFAVFIGMMANLFYEWLMRIIGMFLDWLTGFSKKMPPN